MAKKILEKQIEAYFVDQVETKLGGEALKLEVKGRRGWPDRLVILPQGEIYFVELKTMHGRLSRAQELRAIRLQDLQHRVEHMWTIEAVDNWINYMVKHLEEIFID